MELAADPLVVPPVDIYGELAAEWFHVRTASDSQKSFVMQELRKELDRQELFASMQEKFGPHA